MIRGDAHAIVLGAGPAGIGAAVAARSCGIDVLVLDEAANAGGQIYRAIPEAFRRTSKSAANPDVQAGDRLRAELAASTARLLPERRVWSVAPGFRVDAIGPSGAETWQAPALLVALGTTERIVPFPGWTTPGVIGLAAATVLLKAQQAVPGERVVVAGCGPLVYAVAYGIRKAGGEVVAALDLAGLPDWLHAAGGLTSRPLVAWRGLGWIRALRSAGVPILFRHGIRAIEAEDGGLMVLVGPVDAGRRPAPGAERRLRADGVAAGHGLVPATEVTRLLGAEHLYEAAAGGWVPSHDGRMRSSVPGLYVAGDCTGIAGADPAELEGRLAGLAVAQDLGRIDEEAYRRSAGPLLRRLRRVARFGRAHGRQMALAPGQLEGISGATVVCRCEDVTRVEIEAALDDGARDVNAVKAWTRAGMGPCQGRVCGDVVAGLVALRVGGRERALAWTPRPPLRPLYLEDLCTLTAAAPRRSSAAPRSSPGSLGPPAPGSDSNGGHPSERQNHGQAS